VTKIKFGTDGWRGIIAEDFTFDNVRIVTQAVADYLREDHPELAEKGVLVGYDNRFMGEQFARAAAEVLAGNHIPVKLSDAVVPTPVISYMVPYLNAGAGILITASHNPYPFNGFKFKPYFGGSADTETTRAIERRLYQHPPQRLAFDTACAEHVIEITDFSPPYVDFCRRMVTLGRNSGRSGKIVVDSMHGAGLNYTARLLDGLPYTVLTIAGERDAYFGGRDPEPIARNLQPLMARTRQEKADIGLATDGDADRIGVVDRQGNFINPHQVFALLTLHLIKHRRLPGDIVKTISSTQLINKIAQKYNREVLVTPVGFKYICEHMRHRDIVIGGEESGGIGFKGHIPERDGLLAGLLLLELIEIEGKPLDLILADVWAEFGRFYYDRIDAHCADAIKAGVVPKLQTNPPADINGVPVVQIDDFDGIKFTMADDSWLLFRPSGTEPVLRLYAEATSPERVTELLASAQQLAGI